MKNFIASFFTRRPLLMLFILVFLVIPSFALLASLVFYPQKEAPQGQFLTPPSTPQKEETTNNSASQRKVIIGRSRDIDTQKIPNIKISQKDRDKTEYSYSSFLILRPGQIITEKGVAVFERVLVSPEDVTGEFSTISAIKEQYGEPEEAIKGSSFYGPYLFTYIYAKRGAAFIVNPNTNEVYEAQFFPPGTAEDYKNRFGKDIDSKINESHEF